MLRVAPPNSRIARRIGAPEPPVLVLAPAGGTSRQPASKSPRELQLERELAERTRELDLERRLGRLNERTAELRRRTEVLERTNAETRRRAQAEAEGRSIRASADIVAAAEDLAKRERIPYAEAHRRVVNSLAPASARPR